MTALLDWLVSDGGRALLLALAHSIWVGGLAWAALVLLFRRLPTRRSQIRYGLALGAQGLVFGLTLFLWSWFAHVAGEVPAELAFADAETVAAANSIATGSVDTITEKTAPLLATAGNTREAAGVSHFESLPQPTVDVGTRVAKHWSQWWGLAWLFGALAVLSSRLWRFGHTWRLSARCPAIANGPWQTLLDEERLRMAYGRAVVLRVVDGLASPAAWGFFKPVILIPASMVTGLSAETMRMILAHELTHLRRWDPLVQALQYVVEAIFFFNPFVWLLSRQIALERESCCDLVAAERADAPTYAEVLLAVGRQQERPGHDVAAPAVLGDGKPSSLAARIGRLLRPADCPSPRLSMGLMLLAVLVTLVAIFVGRQASDAAVAALTHQEWIQEIQADLETERREQGADWDKGDQMLLTGRITNQAGEGLPDASVRLQMHFVNGSPSYSTSAVVDEFGNYRRELKLTRDSPAYGRHATVSATVAAPGYEVVKRSQIPTVKTAAEENFTLAHGIPVEMEFVNEAGAALAGIDLKIKYKGEDFQFKETYTSDAAGRLQLVLPSDEILRFTIGAPGYRDWRQQRSFTNDSRTMRITLKRGSPIRGVVRDAESGQPIAGAGVFLIHSVSPDGSQSRSYSFRGGQKDPLVRTNAQGVFEIYSLSEEKVHWLVIGAEGYLAGFPGPEDSRVSGKLGGEYTLAPSSELAEVKLIPKRPLRIKILPPTGWTAEDDSDGYMRYSHSYFTGIGYGRSWSSGSPLRRKELAVEQGVIEAVIQPTMAAPLRIGLNRTHGPGLTVEGWDYGETVVVDLRDQPSATHVEREYIVRIELPVTAPEPKGEINVDYTGSGYGSGEIAVPLQAGIASFTIKHRFDRVPEIDSSGVIGYTFEKQKLPRSINGDVGPLIHTVRGLQPAGALNLMIENSMPDESVGVTVEALQILKKGFLSFGSKKEWVLLQTKGLTSGANEAVVSPVPFGQKIRVSLSQGVTWTREVFPPVQESDPFPAIKMRLPDGGPVSGRVLDSKGQALGGVEVVLGVKIGPRGYRYRTVTDVQGMFAFERVNFDTDADYHIRVMGVSGYQQYVSKLEKPNRDLQIRLETSIPRTVRVVVAETDEPLVGKLIQVSEIRPTSAKSSYGAYVNPEMTTNNAGEVLIDSLPASGRFGFYVYLPPDGEQGEFYVEQREIDKDDQTIVVRVPEARLR